jgi:hypothetical protein
VSADRGAVGDDEVVVVVKQLRSWVGPSLLVGILENPLRVRLVRRMRMDSYVKLLAFFGSR